jgi:hypothetical protein
VQAGLSIIADIEALNEAYFTRHFDETIQIGIGVHIGKVITGAVMNGNEEHSVVMGFPVNVASRLQSATVLFRFLDINIEVAADLQFLQFCSLNIYVLPLDVRADPFVPG